MARRPPPPADGWEESTEGDLDPDLIEEAGYAGWDPPRRRGASLLAKIGVALVLLAMIAGALRPLL